MNPSSKTKELVQNEFMDTSIISKKNRRKLKSAKDENLTNVVPEVFKETVKEQVEICPEYVFLKAHKSRNYKDSDRIQVENFDLHTEQETLLKDVKLNLIYGQKYGIVGRNGVGKSSLLRAIAERKDKFDKIPNFRTILMVEQEILNDLDPPLNCLLNADKEREWLIQTEKTLLAETIEPTKRLFNLTDIQERLYEIEAHRAEDRAKIILLGLGFNEDEITTKPAKEYSGGWRMRIALAVALYLRPTILILDEPTNHLDLHAVIWLEKYLMQYPYMILLVSHDETLLDTVVNNIIHFEDQTLKQYRGNFSAFRKQMDQKQRELINQSRSGSKKVKIRPPRADVKFDFPPVPCVRETALIQFKNVKFGYSEDKILLNSLDFGIYHGAKIGIVGENGVGKTTIMKLILGAVQPLDGQIVVDPHVRIAHFSQHHIDQLNMDATPIEHLQHIDPELAICDIRKHLGRFGITGKLACQKIDSLSGGQKSRVTLAGSALLQPDIMLLDEPSNHLDIFALTALIDGLKLYEGSLLIISHNQKLIDSCCNELWVVSPNTHVDIFPGTFREYKETILWHL